MIRTATFARPAVRQILTSGIRCYARLFVAPRFVACLIAASAIQTATAGEPGKPFLDFVKTRAAALRAADKPPASLDEWEKRRGAIREQLLRAWG